MAMKTTPESDPFPDWLAGARGGCSDHLGRAMEACRQYLMLIARDEMKSVLRPKAGASDLVQNCFVDATSSFENFAGSTRDEFIAWMTTILRNNLVDFARAYNTKARSIEHEQPLAEFNPACDTPTASAIVASQEEERRLRKALTTLPDEYRLIIAWRQHDRLEWNVIAERLNKTADAARLVWYRAIEQLRLQLRPPHDNDDSRRR
ncbi:MAG: RNA polymerase sigma factor [Gemmataceae bacterium]